MINNILNGKNLVHRSLDATWVRHKTISQNIANIDTPEYKRLNVSFEESLRQAMESPNFNKREVDHIPIEITQDHSQLSTRLDGNNVDIDVEMAEMAKNTLRYETLIQLSSYNKLKMILKDGV